MTGFLPITIASNGTAPKAAHDAAAPQPGVDGAFGAVLAGLMGDGRAEAAPAQNLFFVAAGQEGAPFETAGLANAAGMNSAGSALQRLKLAFADADMLPGRSALNGTMASSVALLAATPADTSAATPADAANQQAAQPVALAAADGTEIKAVIEPATEAAIGQPVADAHKTRKPQADAVAAKASLPEATLTEARAPEVVADAAATVVAMAAAVAPALPQQTAELATELAAEPGFRADGLNAAEPSAGNSETAPRTETPAPQTPPVQTPAVEPDPDFVQRDLPTARHDLSGRAQTRPLTATVTALSTQPSQSWTTPTPDSGADSGDTDAAAPTIAAVNGAPVTSAAKDAPEAGDAAVLAAIAPAAGQVASSVRDTAGGQRRAGAASEDVTSKPAMAADVMAGLADIAPMATAPVTAAPVAGAATATPDALVGLIVETPEQVAASLLAAKPAPAQTTPGLGDMRAAEPAANGEQIVTAANADADTDADTDAGRSLTDTGNTAQSGRIAQSAEQQATPQPGQQVANQSASQSGALPDGMQPVPNQPLHAQPLHSQPLHSQPGTQPGLAHGADVVRVATPQQLPEAVGVAISRHVGAEATEFTLRLDPAELGRIEVKLEMGKDGQATVSIQADNASTFDLLRRDSSALERALAEAGLKLDSGGLNFSLRQQDGQGQQQNTGEGAQRQATGRMQEASLAGSEQDNTPRPTRRNGAAGLLDLSI